MIAMIGVRDTHERVQLGTAGNLEDARAEAAFFLEDPRDTLQAVYLWDERDQQYRGWLNRPKPNYAELRRTRRDTAV